MFGATDRSSEKVWERPLERREGKQEDILRNGMGENTGGFSVGEKNLVVMTAAPYHERSEYEIGFSQDTTVEP